MAWWLYIVFGYLAVAAVVAGLGWWYFGHGDVRIVPYAVLFGLLWPVFAYRLLRRKS